MKITREQFLRYEEVRNSGEFNMIMDAPQAMFRAQLLYPEYMYIINHYSELKEKYLK